MTFMPLLGYYVLRGQKGMESAADAKGWTRMRGPRAIGALPAGASPTRR